jgi:hypothetical protein
MHAGETRHTVAYSTSHELLPCMGEAVKGDHEPADLFRALQDAMGRGNVFKREDSSERSVPASSCELLITW